jgi:hypothetical protein
MVEKLASDCIDVRELQRAGVFRDHSVTLRPSLRLPSIKRMHVTRYRIQLELSNQIVSQQIPVSWTHCNYGGTKPWMHCSFCQRRIARLFKGMGGYFCRACLDYPLYESQRRSSKARAYLEAYRLRQRLGGSRPLDRMPTRPYRMKRRQYRELVSRIECLESSLVGSKVLRHAPEYFLPLTY